MAIIALALLFMLFGLSRLVKGILSTNWLSPGRAVPANQVGRRVADEDFIYISINGKVAAWIAAKGAAFNQPFDYTGYKEQLTNAISELGLPKFIASLISDGINISDAPADLTLAEVLAPAFSNIIVTMLAVIIIILFFMIVFKTIISLIGKLFNKGVLGTVNRILGAGLGLVKAYIFVSIIMLLISALSGIIGLERFRRG